MVSKPEAAEFPVYRMTSFVGKLSDANLGKGYESEGWEIRTVGNDGTIVYKQGLALRVPLEKGLIQDNSMIPGKLLSVNFPKEFLGMSPGHYMALSDRELTQEHLEDLVRLYWHLTPYGTAGVACAMLQLLKITGQSKYFDIAQQAFEYERYWFNPEIGNWPDFRETGRSKKHLPFMTAWCHGAPGIALSRLHAYETLADETYKAEAIIALDTTRKMVESGLNSSTSNFSLCHGLAGNTDVLLHASQILGQQENDDTDLVHHVANVGIETYASNGHQWPCGVPSGGETPNLMLGLAGIGYFYLRLHTPSVPSVLILRQEALKQSFCRGYI